MAADDVRDELAKLLEDWPVGEPCQLISGDEAGELAEFLLPTVDRIAREAAGKALRDAADEIIAGLGVGGFNPASPYAGAFRDGLRARAEAADGGGQA